MTPYSMPLHYWAVVFVQMLSLVLYCCSWIPLWRMRSIVEFQNPRVNGAFMSPHFMLALLLPAGVALQLGIYFILMDDGNDGRSYTVVYALLIAQMSVFSIWLVPYAARREAWWSLALLAVAWLLGVATVVMVAVPLTGEGFCVAGLVALVCWNAALLCVAAGNAALGLVFGGWQVIRTSREPYEQGHSNSNRDVLAFNVANPVELALDLITTLAGTAN